MSLFAPDPTAADERITKLVNDLPGLLGWFWEIASDLLVLWPLVLLSRPSWRRVGCSCSAISWSATVLAAGVATLVGRWVSRTLVDGLTATGPPPCIRPSGSRSRPR